MADKTEIKKGMTIGDIVSSHPECAQVLMEHGFHCLGCAMASMETLEQGAKAHGMDDKQVTELVKKLNSTTRKK
jgi:hybrid cluster-associated redox disulfide protein